MRTILEELALDFTAADLVAMLARHRPSKVFISLEASRHYAMNIATERRYTASPLPPSEREPEAEAEALRPARSRIMAPGVNAVLEIDFDLGPDQFRLVA